MNSASLLQKPRSLFNMTKITTKLALVSSALLLTFSAQNAYSAEKNYDNLHKQLNIMNNIMLSSAQASQQSRQSLIRSIDSFYLKGQGAIFTIKSNHWGSSQHQFFQMVSPKAPLPPVAPLAPVSRMPPMGHGDRVIIEDNDDFDIEFSEDGEELERVIELYEQQREGARELRSDQREIAYELRDVERQRKDIEYQLQRVEKNEKNELNAELNKLQKESVALNKSKKRLDQKVMQQNKQLEQQRAAQQKARKVHFNALNSTLVETLCLYGNGLQGVPSKEHVSLIIKDGGNKAGRGYNDQIFVFTKKDINACASNKLTAEKLLAKAEQYQF
jgi:hypothetical protein